MTNPSSERKTVGFRIEGNSGGVMKDCVSTGFDEGFVIRENVDFDFKRNSAFAYSGQTVPSELVAAFVSEVKQQFPSGYTGQAVNIPEVAERSGLKEWCAKNMLDLIKVATEILALLIPK